MVLCPAVCCGWYRFNWWHAGQTSPWELLVYQYRLVGTWTLWLSASKPQLYYITLVYQHTHLSDRVITANPPQWKITAFRKREKRARLVSLDSRHGFGRKLRPTCIGIFNQHNPVYDALLKTSHALLFNNKSLIPYCYVRLFFLREFEHVTYNLDERKSSHDFWIPNFVPGQTSLKKGSHWSRIPDTQVSPWSGIIKKEVSQWPGILDSQVCHCSGTLDKQL